MSWPRPLQISRRTVQVLVLVLVILVPVLARYTNYLSAREMDRTLRRFEGSAQGVILETTDQAMRSVVGEVDRGAGPGRNRDGALELARQVKGTTWSLELFGLSLTDPLAALESAAASHTVRWVLLAGIILPVALTLLLGRVFCSWICPVGLLLDLTGKLRGVLRFLELRPGRTRLWYGDKYLLLALGLGLAFAFGAPFLGYFYPPALLGREIHNGVTVMFDRGEEGMLGFTAAGLTLASWFLLGVAVVELCFGPRIWCRALCPGGAVYALIGRFRLLRVKRNASACTQCGECVVRCPMGLSPMTDVIGLECDNCGECVSHCPDKALGWHLTPRERNAPRQSRPSPELEAVEV